MLYFFILLLLVRYLRVSLSQYFLNYSGCYSNLGPLQDIAAGGIWYGRGCELLSSLLCTEIEVMLSTPAPPLGLAASVAGICPPGWLQKSAPCLCLGRFQFTATFAVTGIPRPFGIKCFVSQVPVFSEKWPPAISFCLCTHCLLGTC